MVVPDICRVCRVLCRVCRVLCPDICRVCRLHTPCLQGALLTLTVPPYPFVPDDPTDVPPEECWLARPQLCFTCHLRPRDGGSPTGRRTYGEDDIQVQWMFDSTFEVLDLPGSGPMETRRVVKLCEPAPQPSRQSCPTAAAGQAQAASEHLTELARRFRVEQQPSLSSHVRCTPCSGF